MSEAEEITKEIYKITNPIVRCKKVIETIQQLLDQNKELRCCGNCEYKSIGREVCDKGNSQPSSGCCNRWRFEK